MKPVSPPSEILRPLRIFVVEDHPDTLKYLTLYLHSVGYTVCSACTLADALVRIPEEQCDVLISDVSLPDGKGWELLTMLRERELPHPAYAIIMSGFGTMSDCSKSYAAGFRHHLLKPFNPCDLGELLNKAAEELAIKQSA